MGSVISVEKPRWRGAFRLRWAVLLWCLAACNVALAQGDATRGEYVAKAGGCMGCHTDNRPGAIAFAGGRELKTDFGSFYGPNITPHAQYGLGKWSETQFADAMRLGRRPDGAHYFPAFPYPSFSAITDGDLRDLWAYLRSLPSADRPNQPHALRWPFGWRFMVTVWKWLFFRPGSFAPNPAQPLPVNRGAYLVKVLGHCGECHTPRNFLGGPKRDRLLAGGKLPEGRAPNLTPTNLKKWSDTELREFLRSGNTPEGDAVSDTMYEVVRNTTSRLSTDDLSAMIAYLRALPPLPD